MSTGGHCVFLGGNLIAWNAKKLEVVSKSSTESEYRSLSNLAADVVWLQSLCTEIGVSLSFPHRVWCDNNSAIALASNPVFHARTKHIEVDAYYIGEKVLAKVIEVGHVPSTDQVAGVFTKPLNGGWFLFLGDKLRLKDQEG